MLRTPLEELCLSVKLLPNAADDVEVSWCDEKCVCDAFEHSFFSASLNCMLIYHTFITHSCFLKSCHSINFQGFLSRAPERPSSKSITASLELLTRVDALDENGRVH